MSWEINASEWHYINNVSSETKKEVYRLIEYIQQFNHMLNVESMNIHCLNVKVDNEEVQIKDTGDWEPENTYVLSKEGLGQNQVEHIQWDNDSELMKLLSKAPDSKHIEVGFMYNAMVLLGESYGINYWRNGEYPEEAKNGNVKWKILEYYDVDPEVCTSVLDEQGERTPVYCDGYEMIKNVSEFFSYNFCITVNVEDDWEEHPEEKEKIMNLANSFAEKFDFYNEPEEPYESEFMFSESFKITGLQIEEVKKSIQDIVDIAVPLGAEIEVCATFTSEDDNNPFAILDFVLEDEKIVVKSCLF